MPVFLSLTSVAYVLQSDRLRPESMIALERNE